MPDSESTEDRRQHVRGDRGTRGNPEHAAFQPAKLSELALGDPFDAKQLTGAGVEQSSCLRQPRRPPAAVEELYMKLPLQLVERFRDRRLAEVQGCGRLGESALVDDCGEQPEMVEIDRHYQKL
jgi:hypothetical protein